MRPEDVPEGPLLVDTDVATWLLADSAPAASWKPLLRGHLLALSFANVGELLALPLSRSWGQNRTREWGEALRSTFVVVPFSGAVAEVWAPLHVRYRGHLHKGGTNDLWVAATALAAEPRLPVATNNLGDFRRVAADYPLTLVHPDVIPDRRGQTCRTLRGRTFTRGVVHHAPGFSALLMAGLDGVQQQDRAALAGRRGPLRAAAGRDGRRRAGPRVARRRARPPSRPTTTPCSRRRPHRRPHRAPLRRAPPPPGCAGGSGWGATTQADVAQTLQPDPPRGLAPSYSVTHVPSSRRSRRPATSPARARSI